MNQICQLLGISKKSYYQSQEPQERLAEKYQALRPVLGRLIEKHPSYGIPRLKKALAEQEGLLVNAKLLRKRLAFVGTHLAAHRRGRPTQEDLGAAGHRLPGTQG